MNGETLTVEGVSLAYDGRDAVVAADLAIRPGRIIALLGPSGCGKSTLLRLVAGLERPDAGWIRLGDRVLAGPHDWVPPEARRVGLVFQDYALFPHLNVLDNVAYGLRGLSPAERRDTAMERLAAMRLADRAGAFPHVLSGGEQQRVALARALAPRPTAILLDEPFSGLDAHLKSAVRAELVATLRDAGAGVLIVTHDAEEAMLMADDLALMIAGRIVQTGSPEACYRDPVSPEAARLLGEAELLEGVSRGGIVQTAFGPAPAPGALDGPMVVVVRPEGVSLADEGSAATVQRVAFGGGFHEIALAAEGQILHMRLATAPPPVGSVVRVRLDPRAAKAFPSDLGGGTWAQHGSGM